MAWTEIPRGVEESLDNLFHEEMEKDKYREEPKVEIELLKDRIETLEHHFSQLRNDLDLLLRENQHMVRFLTTTIEAVKEFRC